MVTKQEIERQLNAIGAKFTWWGKAEVKELEHIIEPSETIMYCINGRYEGGFAMLCVTDRRALLIDKKPLYLSLEDLRYDMISEVAFDGRLVDSTIIIYSSAKQLRFTSFKGDKLRKATAYLQRRVMEIRQHPQSAAGQFVQQAVDNLQGGVHSYEYRITNPYTKIPLMMRRKIPRFYN